MATASESSSVAPGVAPTGWTIRGKWFVAPFVIVLILLLAWTLAIAIQFQAIMTRLDRARSDWPSASQDLAKRFADFDVQVQGGNSAISEIDRRAWNEAFAAFQQTSQYDRQSAPAATLERLRLQGSNPSESEITPAIAKLLSAEKERLAAQQSLVGRCAITALRLNLPGTYAAGD
ncbi:MAG: hypothetical protein ACK494_09850 [Planctomycetota bacterium]